jgi:hypothetical protein
LRRARKVALASVVAILSLSALYVVAANVFLSTSLFEELVDRDAEHLDVHFHRGWSIVPGRVHAQKPSIRSSDSRVEWILRVDEVALRMRRKLPAPALTDGWVAALPPVPGFDRLPMRSPEPTGPEVWDDRQYRLFTLRLDRVVANDVREIWVDQLRVEGHLRVAGSFFLKPICDVRVGPVDVSFSPGAKASFRARDAATDLDGTARVAIGRFDPRVTSGDELVARLSLGTDLRFHVPDAGTWPMPAGFDVHGAADVHRLAIDVEDGVLRPRGGVDVSMPRATMDAGGHRVRAALVVKSAIGEGADDGRTRMELRAELGEVAVEQAIDLGTRSRRGTSATRP